METSLINMINPNILDALKSNMMDPSYSTIITGFKQPEHCNKNELQILIEQINPNLYDIIFNQNDIINTYEELLTQNDIPLPDNNRIELNTIVSKTLQIESFMEFDNATSMFISGLTGQVINDLQKGTPSNKVDGQINYNRVSIIKPDSPQYLNFSKFNVRKRKIRVTVPEIIQNIIFKLTHNNITLLLEDETIEIEFGEYTYMDIEDGKLNISLDNICDNLFDEYNVNDEIETNEAQIVEYESQKIIKEDDDLTEEEIEFNNGIDAEIEILENANIKLAEKNNTIKKALDQLSFSEKDKFDFHIEYDKKSDLTEQHIETIVTNIKKEIDIDFEYKYKTLPSVIITVDERLKLFSSYSLEFKQDDGLYTGVVIYLNNLKRINQSPDINIAIIGG